MLMCLDKSGSLGLFHGRAGLSSLCDAHHYCALQILWEAESLGRKFGVVCYIGTWLVSRLPHRLEIFLANDVQLAGR